MDDVAIIGVGQSVFARKCGVSVKELCFDAYKEAIEGLNLTNKDIDTNVIYKREQGISYTLIVSKNAKEIYAGGLSSKNFKNDFAIQVDESYKLMRAILQSEGFTFADIVRQWNYVEGILSINEYDEEHIQHYQILNDIRSKYYAEADFQNGYPAATGIGMDAGGPLLEFYAVQSSANADIFPIMNPKQVDAYHYSENVLVGDSLEKNHKKTKHLYMICSIL